MLDLEAKFNAASMDTSQGAAGHAGSFSAEPSGPPTTFGPSAGGAPHAQAPAAPKAKASGADNDTVPRDPFQWE